MKDNGSYRSGFVSILGKPNVGKSSLINSLLKEKVAAVSSKPQTTRNAVRVILTTDEAQIVFVDTPGIHKPKHALGEFMMQEAEGAMGSVDAICFVVEAGRPIDSFEEKTAERLASSGIPVVLVVNKIDKLRGEQGERRFWDCLEPIQTRLAPAAVVPVSATDATNLDVLVEEIIKLLPEGDAIYPEDMLMDTTERFLAEEIIREKIFEATEQEIPHSVAVITEEFKTPDEFPELKTAQIRVDIVVERPGQKGIIIGDKGKKLKQIGSAARLEMEERFGYPIFLQLWVKVRPGWRKSKHEIERYGYRRHTKNR